MHPQITKQDHNIVMDYIYLNYLIEVLESDLQAVPSMPFKLQLPYEHLITNTLIMIKSELKHLKVIMKEKNIKVVINHKMSDEMFIQYDYMVRGFKGIHRMWDAAMKLEGSRRLEEYFKI